MVAKGRGERLRSGFQRPEGREDEAKRRGGEYAEEDAKEEENFGGRSFDGNGRDGALIFSRRLPFREISSVSCFSG